MDSDKTTSHIDQRLDQLSKGKEDLHWEKIDLLEDNFVQTVESQFRIINRVYTNRDNAEKNSEYNGGRESC